MVDGLKDKHRRAVIEALAANPRVEKVVLFGSRAMETFTPESDVDIALYGDNLTLSDQAKLAAEIERLPIPQQIDLLRHNTITSKKLLKHIRQHGVVLYERTSPGKSEEKQFEASCSRTSMPFTEAVEVNPSIRMEKGKVYPFVEMAAVDPGARSVHESEHRAFKSGGARFAPGDTLMARITPCLENGKIARFRPSDETSIGFGSTEFIVIRGKDRVTTDDFAYYLTKWNEFRQFAVGQMTGSSGRQRVPAGSLSGFEVAVPPLPTQRRIGSILGSLDDKIELNRRMNRTLERMAQAVFKSWFIDFDPVHAKATGRDPSLPDHLADLFPDTFQDSELGQIPEGWEVKSLDKIAHYLNGLACQKHPPIKGENSLPVIKIRELRQGITANSNRANLHVKPKYFVDDGDILFSWSGSLLVTIWCNGRGVLNQHVFKVTSSDHPKWYYYQATKHHLEEFQRIAADKATTMGHIKRHHLSDAKIAVPPNLIMDRASEILGTTLERRINALKQARSLALMRDTLLPKLLSGEIEVSDAEELIKDLIQ